MKKITIIISILFSLTAAAQNLKFDSAHMSWNITKTNSYHNQWSVKVRDGNDTMDVEVNDTSCLKFIKYNNKTVALKDLFKKDTIVRIGYVITKTDTSVVEGLTYIQKNRIKYCSPGFLVLERQAITFDGKNYQWIGDGPKLIAALNNKKKPVTPYMKPIDSQKK